MPRRTIVASRENLHEVVASLRPDLRLVTRRELDTAIALLVDARERGAPLVAQAIGAPAHAIKEQG